MKQATFMEYLNHRIGEEFDVEDLSIKWNFCLTKRTQEYRIRIKGIRYKASLEFKEMIDQYARIYLAKGFF